MSALAHLHWAEGDTRPECDGVQHSGLYGEMLRRSNASVTGVLLIVACGEPRSGLSIHFNCALLCNAAFNRFIEYVVFGIRCLCSNGRIWLVAARGPASKTRQLNTTKFGSRVLRGLIIRIEDNRSFEKMNVEAKLSKTFSWLAFVISKSKSQELRSTAEPASNLHQAME